MKTFYIVLHAWLPAWAFLMAATFGAPPAHAITLSDIKIPMQVTFILPKKTPTVCDALASPQKECCNSYLTGSSDHSLCGGACTSPDPAVKACCEAAMAPGATPEGVKAACPSTPGAVAGPGSVLGEVELAVDCRCDNPQDEARQCSKEGVVCCFAMTKDPDNPKKAMATPFTCEVRLTSDETPDRSETKALLASTAAPVQWKQTAGPQIGSAGGTAALVTGVTDLPAASGLEFHGTLPGLSNLSGDHIGLTVTLGGNIGQGGIFATAGVQGGACGCFLGARPIDAGANLLLTLLIGTPLLLLRRRVLRVRRLKGYLRGR